MICFAQRLLQGRRIYKFISICELCLQLEDLTSCNVVFRNKCLVLKKVFVIFSIKVNFASFGSYDLNSENLCKLELYFCSMVIGYLI